MAAPPRLPNLSTYASLLNTLNSFLTVSIHTLLYERGLYPTESFISARAYNFAVRQSRHPEVCRWINDAVAAVEKEMSEGRVERISLVIYDIGGEKDEDGKTVGRKDASVVERWVFDVGTLPVIGHSDRLVELEVFPAEGAAEADDEDERQSSVGSDEAQDEHTEAKLRIEMTDIEEQLRGTIRKLAHTAEKMPKLPAECTYTLAVELKEEAEPPIGHPQPWIPSEPSIQKGNSAKNVEGPEKDGFKNSKATPIRAVEAGAFSLETWVERAG